MRLTHTYISPLSLNIPLTRSCCSTRFHRNHVNSEIESICWPLAKVFPGLQIIRRDFLRPFCTILGTFLGLRGFPFALVFNLIAQLSQDNFWQPQEASSAPPTPSRYNLRNLALQLHAPVNSDFLNICMYICIIYLPIVTLQ